MGIGLLIMVTSGFESISRSPHRAGACLLTLTRMYREQINVLEAAPPDGRRVRGRGKAVRRIFLERFMGILSNILGKLFFSSHGDRTD